jgi:thioredoxin reductase (NADPH)
LDNPKVSFIWNTVVTEVVGSGKVEAVRLKNLQTGETSLFPTEGVFIFVGHTPNTQIFQGQLVMDARGYIRADTLTQTSVPGVYAAGEAADPTFRQVVTSAGMGAAAAIQVTRFLEQAESKESSPEHRNG